ncbi:MAG TPA: methyltransferase domain-containing protein [Bryobacteraceae bacterium]|nr:methyltransferase domain-containing protein [Bryobacteraceae bacterium]
MAWAAKIRMVLFCLSLGVTQGQTDGGAAYRAFVEWKQAPQNRGLSWEIALEAYTKRLIAGGMEPGVAAKTISIITARDEGTYYDPVYEASAPKFITAPNKLLVEAVAERMPGRALDVAMGQGRNSLYLAGRGWQVTGFDVSHVGIEQAQKAAARQGLSIRTQVTSDEEFDFGNGQWDLIAILYPIEKRSVYRVRQALKSGGLVVVECSHKEAANAPFEYDTNELLKIFEGFRIIKYEDSPAEHEWARKKLRLVRLIAQKQ